MCSASNRKGVVETRSFQLGLRKVERNQHLEPIPPLTRDVNSDNWHWNFESLIFFFFPSVKGRQRTKHQWPPWGWSGEKRHSTGENTPGTEVCFSLAIPVIEVRNLTPFFSQQKPTKNSRFVRWKEGEILFPPLLEWTCKQLPRWALFSLCILSHCQRALNLGGTPELFQKLKNITRVLVKLQTVPLPPHPIFTLEEYQSNIMWESFAFWLGQIGPIEPTLIKIQTIGVPASWLSGNKLE